MPSSSDMDHIDTEAESFLSSGGLSFPPLTKSHILHCSYHYWHPRYRAITPKARLIPLTDPFLAYLRADGIILPPENSEGQSTWSDDDSGIFSSTETASESDDEEDPSDQWRDIHEAVKSTIAELGGKVVPKLNWSAPKDATWISATNSMECRTPNDVYLLLKSSNFITHDLEYAFDGCIDDDAATVEPQCEPLSFSKIPYCLVLRKHILLNPSLEFRCFVRQKHLIALCQRDLNYFEFLFKLSDRLRDRIQDFFASKLQDTFPEENYTFDVYVPPPHQRVWLIDINPWSSRTDALLFSWAELLTTVTSESSLHNSLSINSVALPQNRASEEKHETSNSSEAIEPIEGLTSLSLGDQPTKPPIFRLVNRDDPEAYIFNSPQYSAHKLPRDIVDATRSGAGGLRELAEQWNNPSTQRFTEDEVDTS